MFKQKVTNNNLINEDTQQNRRSPLYLVSCSLFYLILFFAKK